MEKNDVVVKLKEIIGITLRDRADMSGISENDDLTEVVGLNSVEAIEILVRTENEFDIEVDDEDLSVDLVKTLSNLADYVLAKSDNV